MRKLVLLFLFFYSSYTFGQNPVPIFKAARQLWDEVLVITSKENPKTITVDFLPTKKPGSVEAPKITDNKTNSIKILNHTNPEWPSGSTLDKIKKFENPEMVRQREESNRKRWEEYQSHKKAEEIYEKQQEEVRKKQLADELEKDRRYMDSVYKVHMSSMFLNKFKTLVAEKSNGTIENIILLTTNKFTSIAFSNYFVNERYFKVYTTKNIGKLKKYSPDKSLVFIDHKLSKLSAKWLSDNNYHFVINVDPKNLSSFHDYYDKKTNRYLLVSAKTKEGIVKMYGNQNADKILQITSNAERIENLAVIDNKNDFKSRYNQLLSEHNIRPIIIFHNNNSDVQFLDSKVNANKIPYGITCNSYTIDSKITSTGYLDIEYLIKAIGSLEEENSNIPLSYIEFIQSISEKYYSLKITDQNNTTFIMAGIGVGGAIYIYCSSKN